jgi:hypothetical protein
METQPGFQYRLRTLFLANASFAIVLSFVRALVAPDSVPVLLLGIGLWIGGAGGVIFLSVLGDAFGQERGMLAAGVLAGLGWAVMILGCVQFALRFENDASDEFHRTLRGLITMQLLAVLLTVGAIVWLALQRLRSAANEADSTGLDHLVEFQRKSHRRTDQSGRNET